MSNAGTPRQTWKRAGSERIIVLAEVMKSQEDVDTMASTTEIPNAGGVSVGLMLSSHR